MTEHERMHRAAQAQALLDNELFKEAFDTLDADYIKAWRATEARDDDARHRYWQACQVLAKVKDNFVALVNDGKIAQREIEMTEQTRLASLGKLFRTV